MWISMRPRPLAWMLFTVAAAMTTRAQAVDLLTEDFEGLTLRPVVTFESELREREAWQQVGPNGPAGWTEVNLTTVNPQSPPGSGVVEFAGWRFVDKEWWILTAGDQDRTQYLSGSGIIAVADPDEWDDFGSPAGAENNLDPANGLFDSTLVTPTISLTGVAAGQAKLFMHSSWRFEDLQTATITAVYNRGTGSQSIIQLDRWASQASDPDFKPDATNESLMIDLQNPAGASNVQIEFRLQGNNDWWWAIDNLSVFTGSAPGEDGVLRAIIDRDTGEVSIENRTGAVIDLRGYSIRSQAGVFNEGAASFLSDSDPDWLQATQPGGDINDLSELHLTSDEFAANGEINFGNVWQGFYRELSDVTFNYLIQGNDDPVRGIVEFVGNGGTSFPYLDLNFSGQVNILDWEQFKVGFATSLTGLTEAARYALGDLDNDKLHTLKDFLEFQRAYDAAQGQGAFARMLAGAPSVPEPSAVLLAMAAIGLIGSQRRKCSKAFAPVLCVAFAIGVISPEPAYGQLTLLFEDFEDVVLGPSVDEGVEDVGGTTGTTVWSEAPPVSITPTTGGGTAPWTIDDSGVPISGPLDPNGNPSQNGITEWAGWATADKDWWVETAGDQERSRFTLGTGNVFVADPDEWDDGPKVYGTPPNFYDAKARTPVITIPAGIPAGRIRLTFDSSWRPEGFDDLNRLNNQTGVIRAIYNGGAPIDVLRWDSDDEGNFFKPDATNEHVTRDLLYNGSATTLQLEFALEKAANDWWWTIDNVLVSVPTDPAKLFINTANGQAFFGGDDTIASQITAINITSKTSLLQTISGGGLTSAISETVDGPDAGAIPGNSPGERWERLASNNQQFAEAFLFGSSSFNDLRRELLGVLINAGTFDQEFAETTNDIELTYTLATGELVTGVVEYFFDQTALPGDYNNNGRVDAADYVLWRKNPAAFGGTPAGYNTWRTNFGRTAGAGLGAAAGVPESSSVLLIAVGIVAISMSRLRRAPLLLTGVAIVGASLTGSVVRAADPPPPSVDRNYRFGEGDSGATVGQPVTQTDSLGNYVTFDTAGALGQNQLIDLIAESPTSRRATYVSTTDRPDGNGGVGLRLNELAFDRQYLRTGFGEALNFPEQSPSSSASLVNPGGTINYFRINDRGFELWAKPTAVTGPHHIVMDSQQHGVLIGANGKFGMRYGSRFTVETQQLPGPDGQLGTPDDVLVVSDPVITPADYSTNITAQANQWYHLSVVRPFGPGLGSIFYINGVAEAIAFGEYAVETIVNVGEGGVFTNIDSLDTSPLTVGRATSTDPSFGVPIGQEFFFRGVVDDLKMFVMGLNDNDNLPGGGSNVLNDYGEYVFDRDNGYAQTFAPSVDADMNINGVYDGMISMADANAFASNWLFEKRLTAVNPITGVVGSRLVGDLVTRSRGDFNYDGIVDLRDWAILNNANPGMGAAAMRLILGQNVPEPTSIAVAVLSVIVLLLRTNRVRQ